MKNLIILIVAVGVCLVSFLIVKLEEIRNRKNQERREKERIKELKEDEKKMAELYKDALFMETGSSSADFDASINLLHKYSDSQTK